jgi:hypothetical protein
MGTPSVYVTVAQGAGCITCGLFGGILNHVLVVRSLGSAANDDRPRTWEYGLAGDVLIGAGAGLLVYLYGYDLPIAKVLGLALVGGVSGGNFWSNALQLREFKKERTRTREYKEAAKAALIPPVRRRQKDEQ